MYITSGSGADLESVNLKIIIHERSCIANFNCGCGELTRVENVKYLGTKIDSFMKWKFHIEMLLPERLIYLFHKLSQILKRTDLIPLYHTLFMSTAIYSITAWGDLNENGVKQLQNISKLSG